MEAAGFVSRFGEEKLGTGELLNLCELSHPLCFPTEVWGGFPEAGRCFFSSELLFTSALSAGFTVPVHRGIVPAAGCAQEPAAGWAKNRM